MLALPSLPFRLGDLQRETLLLTKHGIVNMLRPLIVMFVVLALSACSKTPPLVTSADVNVVTAGALPVPTRADIGGEERPYLIGPFDKITVDVFGVPELSKDVQADAGGRVSLPLIGSIDARGQTAQELAAQITSALRGRFVRNPQVTVNLKEIVSQVITVDGQVREPGLYPVIGRMSLIRAVATAKGVSEFAKLEDVVVFRTVNQQKLAALYDLKAIRRGVYEDPEIFANDVIVVGDSQSRRLFKDALQLFPALVTPLVLLLR
jgi:polysaccharide biosynthesis/export protein